MEIETVIVGQLDTNCFVVFDRGSKAAIVIDPGDEPDKIIAVVEQNDLRLLSIIFTHAHYDHVCAVRELKEYFGAGLLMHEAEAATYNETKKLCMSWGYDPEDFPLPDRLLKDQDKVKIGEIDLRVIHTPGHTPGGICLHGEDVLFAGDTLFRGSVGRTDLPGGSMDALLQSLKKLALLDPSTRVLCGHDEETTIGRETGSNPYLRFR